MSQLRTESGECSDGPIRSSNIDKEQNVTDVAGGNITGISFGISPSTNILKNSSLELNKFFARPVQLAALNIPENTDVGYFIDVWRDYFLNPTVRAKLRNYAFLRGDLHMRVAVSGTPFHYGRLQVAYVPCPRTNPVLTGYEASTGVRDNTLRYLSCVKSSAVMNVKNNEPLDIHAPFISPMPMLRLFNLNDVALTDSTPFDDTLNMGRLYLTTLNRVQSISGAGATNVSVYVYCWMTNVELGCPTGTFMQITTESDERKVGPIEKVTSSLASYVGMLNVVPILEPYARPSQMILQGMSKIASLFGWSVPVMIQVPQRVKNEPFQNSCTVVGCDTGHRMTLDPLQELTVDPRVMATSEDEMSYAFLTKRQSFLTRFEWSPTDPALADPLFRCMVSPTACVALTHEGRQIVQPSCLAYAALPHNYWRGKITYTFEIVRSQFHRGKFAIIYEPNVSQSILINANLDLNKQFIQIVDIQETDTFSVCVDWAHSRSWAQVAGLVTASDFINSTTVTPSDYVNFCNGYIAVVPITRLQAPEIAPLEINVYISSDDMRFNRVSLADIPKEIRVEADSTPVSTCFQLNPTGSSSEDISIHHFGEEPTSFRSLLKRFMTTYVNGVTVSDAHWGVRFRSSMYPPFVGMGVEASTAEHNLFTYLRLAYIGMRGSIRKRVKISGLYQDYLSQARVSLDPDSSTSSGPSLTGLDWNINQIAVLDGTTFFATTTNAGIEFELPFYSNNLFVYASGSEDDTKLMTTYLRDYHIDFDSRSPDASDQFSLIEDTATGEDFMFFGFVAPPPFKI